jgi:predicted lipid carrier protein YhbT
MLTQDRKEKIADMLTKIKKKKRLAVPVRELNLYRVRYDNKSNLHCFNQITQEDFNSDIFPYSRNSRTATFFICSNIDPRKPIL